MTTSSVFLKLPKKRLKDIKTKKDLNKFIQAHRTELFRNEFTGQTPAPKDFLVDFCERNNLTVAEAAPLFGIVERTLYAYRSGDHRVTATMQSLIALLDLVFADLPE